MFTGIVEGLGSVRTLTRVGGGVRMGIRADFSMEGVRPGESIAVSGVCLTVVGFADEVFEVDVAPETLSRTTMDRTRVGDRVNLERALRMGDRLGGHLVSGHVDAVGTVKASKPLGNAILFTFAVPGEISRHIIKKGSVAVDGVSLTVNACTDVSFEVSIIPHTARVTTIGLKKVGDPVNIETDIIGKYVERLTRAYFKGDRRQPPAESYIDESMLSKTGFI